MGSFNSLVGHRTIWRRLTAAFFNDRIAGAYLFHGPPGAGKEGFAIRFASLLNCHNPSDDSCGICPSCKKFQNLQHPNLTLVVPLPKDRDISKDDAPVKALSDRTLGLLHDLTARKARDLYEKIVLPRANTILLNSIRSLRGKIYLKAVEAGRKMILFFDAHKLMTQQGESGNALLKILEEPPGNTTFVLTTDYPDLLSETIHSRCQSVYFPPLSESEIVHFLRKTTRKDDFEAQLVAHLSQGNVHTAQYLVTEDMEQLDTLLLSLINWITSESETGWRNFLNHGIKVYRTDSQEFSFHLQLLSYWFRDALHVQKANGDAAMILAGAQERIRDFIKRYPSADFTQIISAIETCADSLSRNFNVNLVLTNLLLDIEENLQGGTRG